MDKPTNESQHSLSTREILLGFIAVMLAVWALKITYIVTMPLVFAFFIVILVRPIQYYMNKILPRRLRWMSVLFAMLAICSVAAGGIYLIYYSFQVFIAKSPQYFGQLQDHWMEFVTWAQEHDIEIRQQMEFAQLPQRMVSLIETTVTSIWYVGAVIVLIFFFTLLMLLEVPEWRQKPENAFRNKSHIVTMTMAAISRKVRQYLLVRTITSGMTGIIGGLWLWFLGVDLAFVWGVVMFILNYVPYIGSIIAVIPPTIVAFVQYGVWWGLLAFMGLTALQQVVGNFLDPRMQGRMLRVSPMVVLLSILFWGWVWGIAGAVLAVPLTVMIVSTCAHVPALRPVAVILSRGDDPQEKMAGMLPAEEAEQGSQ